VALSDIQPLVDGFVRDASATIDSIARDDAIGFAVQRLSEDRPRPAVEDVTADGTNLLPLPAAWETDFSSINHIEYPIGFTPPTLIDQSEWAFYLTPSGLKIQTLNAIGSGESVRLNFTIAHVLDGMADTVLRSQNEAVAAYAASLCLYQLAGKYNNDSDATIAADSVDHRNKGKDYMAAAARLRTLYFQRLGIREEKTGPAGTVVDLDLRDSRGRDRITHPRRFR